MIQSSKNVRLTSVVFVIALAVSTLMGAYEYKQSKSHWGVRIDNKLINSHTNSSSIINLDHEFGDKVPANLVIKINDIEGKTKIQQISKISNSTLSHRISMAKSKIKNIFLQSQANMTVKAGGRLLQSVDQSSASFNGLVTFITYFVSICRNLIILATVTATFDVWMPLLMFIQCFLCLAYWTHNAHYFTIAFTNIFNCKFDLFNFIRLTITSQQDISTNPYLAAYGLTNKFALNCSGQLSLFILIIVITVILKLLGLFVKSQKLRLVCSKLRAVWNGYVFWMAPKILCCAGFSLRLASQNPTGMQILHLLLAAVGILIIMIFFVLLLIQIRKINAKLEYIEQSRFDIGLASRYDYMRDFQFDCLQYSNLYYPLMNLGRLMVANLCIGLAPDFHYVQFGGVIAGQVFYLMIQISSSGYKDARNKVLYPILDFVYIIFLLDFIGVGLIYSVGHLQLTLKLEIVAFSLIFFEILVTILLTILDIIQYCRTQSFSAGNKNFSDAKDLGTVSTNNQNFTKTDENFMDKKNTQKQYIRPQEQNSDIGSIVSYKTKKLTSDKQKQDSLGSGKAMTTHHNGKIKKIKNGKMI